MVEKSGTTWQRNNCDCFIVLLIFNVKLQPLPAEQTLEQLSSIILVI